MLRSLYSINPFIYLIGRCGINLRLVVHGRSVLSELDTETDILPSFKIHISQLEFHLATKLPIQSQYGQF